MAMPLPSIMALAIPTLDPPVCGFVHTRVNPNGPSTGGNCGLGVVEQSSPNRENGGRLPRSYVEDTELSSVPLVG